MLECVVNVSEGRRDDAIARMAAAAGSSLLDVHRDRHHHRSVLTLAGPDVADAARAVSTSAVAEIDLRRHDGVHPRLGAVDVVPFAPLDMLEPASRAGRALRPASQAGRGGATDLGDAVVARDRFAHWAAEELELPCFVYGPERSLPEVRRQAFRGLAPVAGPARPHPTAGATAVGARPPLVAYNLWLAAPTRETNLTTLPGWDAGPAARPAQEAGPETRSELALARAIAAELRSPAVRALGLEVGGRAQVSCNLIRPLDVGPAVVYDAVARGAEVDRAELVGLVPAAVLDDVPAHRWNELGLDRERTIEARLEAAGIR